MNCPNCKKEIPESLLKSWWASLGGKKSKREITPEQQAKMQKARMEKKASCNHNWIYEPRGICSGLKTRVCVTCGALETASTPY